MERVRRPKEQLWFDSITAELDFYSEWISAINAGWQEFYPSTRQQFHVDLAIETKMTLGSFDVFLSEPDGEGISVDHLSAGQLEIFLFLASLALNEDSEGVVFIDEPELHLDPQWHRPIVRSLIRLQPRAQFIIATHSSEIYDAAQSYERHFLVNDDDPRAKIWGEIRRLEGGA